MYFVAKDFFDEILPKDCEVWKFYILIGIAVK